MRNKTVKETKNTEWISAFDLINQARKQLKNNTWNLLTIFVGYIFVYLVMSQLINRYATVNKVVKLAKHHTATVTEIKNYPAFFLFAFLMILALNLFNLFVYFYGFRNAESKSVEIGEAFRSVKRSYLKFLFLTLIIFVVFFINILILSAILSLFAMFATVGISILAALVVAFLETYLLLPRLVLVYAIILEEKLGIIDAVKKSWKITKPHLTKIQMYILATFSWAFLAFLLGVMVIGIPISIYILMFVLTSPALLYNYVKSNQ